MRRYFFHLLGPGVRSDDEIGFEFENVDDAFLEASRAALEIGAEMIMRREDPTGFRFEICDEELGPIFDLPFRELLRGNMRPWPQFVALRNRLEENLARGRAANGDIADGILEARKRLQAIRDMMGQLSE